jgi:hypothetical protein
MAGNWKMNLNHIDASRALVQKLAWTLAGTSATPTPLSARPW